MEPGLSSSWGWPQLVGSTSRQRPRACDVAVVQQITCLIVGICSHHERNGIHIVALAGVFLCPRCPASLRPVLLSAAGCCLLTAALQEGSWQWVDIWNCLYRERIIFLSKPVDEELGNQVRF